MARRMIFLSFASVLLSALAILLPIAGNAGPPAPPLPPLVIPAPPPVFLIPGTYAYFASDVNVDLFFYGGFWYRPYGGRWYRSSRYGGPWGFIVPNRVPRVLINLPPGYRNVPPGHQRITYGQLHKKWKTWERERHWDNPGKHGKHDTMKREEREQTGRGFNEEHMRGHGR